MSRPLPVVCDGHTPKRPLWTCQLCGDAWPCRVVRKVLAEAHADPETLARRMLSLAEWAAGDLGMPSPALLYRRFVAWTLDKDHCCRVCGKRGHDVLPGVPPRYFPCDKLHEVNSRGR